MPFLIFSQFLLAVVVGVSLAALCFGDTAERRVGALLLLSNSGELMAQTVLSSTVRPYCILAVELATAIALILVAWRSKRSWPTWAASFQSMSTAVALVKAVGFHVSHNAYAAAVNLATYGVVIALAVGTFVAWREREALKMMSSGL